MSLHVQLVTVAMMMLSGLAMGAVFDSYRVVSGQLRIHRFFIPVFDIVYWMAATIFVFRVLYANNQGEVRFYVFLGLFLGVWFYFLVISSITIRFVLWLIRVIKMLVRFLVRCFDVLVITPLMALYKLLTLFFGFGLALSMFLYKIVLQSLRPFWKLTLWLVKPLLKYIKIPGWVTKSLDAVKRLWKRLF